MPSPAGSKRRQSHVLDLMMKGYEVEVIQEDWPCNVILDVEFRGPKHTPYEDGLWIVRVLLPRQYPFVRPSVLFVNKIFHPNIDFVPCGDVYMEVLRRKWSPASDLVDVFERFLPRLLRRPNDPENMILNEQAASLLYHDEAAFQHQVREHCFTYAREEVVIGNSPYLVDKEESCGSNEE